MKPRWKHFLTVRNWVDMIGLLLTLIVIVFGVNEPDSLVDKKALRVISAFASLCILSKTFDWLRLFEKTAFYV